MGMRLLQITDTHLFSNGGETLLGLDTGASFQSVVDLACREFPAPDAVLATGDLAQDASLPAYRDLAAGLERIGAPVYWIPGNHDDQSVAAAALSDPFFRPERSFLLGRWQVVLLDSAVPGHVGGRVSERELERLANCLAAHPGHHALVTLHHQPVPVGSRWLDALGLDNAEALFGVLDHHVNVRVLLWGHVHQEYRDRRGGLELISSPSTCLQFRPGSRDFSIDEAHPGFRWLELHDDGRFDTGVVRLREFVYIPDKGAVGY